MASSSTPAQSQPATEATPLASSAHLQRNYQTSDTVQPAKDIDDADSSDSGGGYVSGAGRRESIRESIPRRESRIQPSRRSTAPGHPAALAPRSSNTGSLRWAALDADVGPHLSASPDAGVSPRMFPTEFAISPRQTPPAADTASQEDYLTHPFQAESHYRRRKQNSSSKTGSHLQTSTDSKTNRKRSRETLTNASADTAQGSARSKRSWFRHAVDKYGAVELDNKGSVARDHLALERTFLAWLRTSLAFASIGIAITQLFRLNSTLNPLFPPSDPTTPSNSTIGTPTDPSATTPTLGRLRTVGKPLGVTFLGVSIMILFMGWRRYFEAQYWIIRGKFPASRGSVFLVTIVAAALIVGSLVVVVIVGRET